MMKRVGIYSGTFDPVHTGHITFAMQALLAARLDELYFLPERQPRRGKTPEHFGHRVAMLKRAVRPHNGMDVLEVTSKQFTVLKTLPELKKRFQNDQLIFLLGSDVALFMPTWPHADQLIARVEFFVGLRGDVEEKYVRDALCDAGVPENKLQIVKSFARNVTSGKIRTALRNKHSVDGLLASVNRYALQEWLYL